MRSLESMLATHPHPSASDAAALLACLEACHECAATCTVCADACLAEEQPQMLRRCIRLNLDCADICETTAAVLSRRTEADVSMLRLQLQACAQACRSCGEECGKHAHHHEHCAVCAEACRHCGEACERMIEALGR